MRLLVFVLLASHALLPMITAEANDPLAAAWLKSVERTPEFQVSSVLEDWRTRREEIRSQLGKLLGKLPTRPGIPQVTTVSREQQEGYVLEKFTFDNGAGSIVPGYLFLPSKVHGKAPAILYCHWHGGEYDIGKEEMFRMAHTPEPPGPTLARRGYIVLGIDACCFGERNGQIPGGEKGGAGEMTASKFNLWAGRSLWGMILRDDLMALDYLASRGDVDASRIGVTGISMGATRSWWLMALDERIKAGVAVACLTRYENLLNRGGLKHHGIYYYVPGMLNNLDVEAVIALSAPRPLLCLNGDRDEGSPVEGIREIEKRASPAWDLYGAGTNFSSRIYPDTGHEYTRDMWERMLTWFDQHLQVR